MTRKASRPSSMAASQSVRNLLARLYGQGSAVASKTVMSEPEWRAVILGLLSELDSYQNKNVQTDQLHETQLAASLSSAYHAVRQKPIDWPGVAEGLVRYALTLFGDWPMHIRRKKGPKSHEHYSLGRLRSLTYRQSTHQRWLTLYQAVDAKTAGTQTPMYQLMAPYYTKHGYRRNDGARLRWFRATYPDIYARVF